MNEVIITLLVLGTLVMAGGFLWNKANNNHRCILCFGCKECTNCILCFFCTNCESCQRCILCVNCLDCMKCFKVRDCIECIRCKRDIGCQVCNNCEGISNAEGEINLHYKK